MENKKDYDWNATAFFESLTRENRLANKLGATFCRVSGLEGFEEALANMQSTMTFVCVSELSQGVTTLSPSPKTRRVKTVFLAMRHSVDDIVARQNCFDTLRELFRQFMSRLILEKTALEEHFLYLDGSIQFEEIQQYFFSGCACAYFLVSVDNMTNLCYDENEWTSRTTGN